MARLPRFDIAGVTQHVVQRGSNRLPCFLDDEERQRCLPGRARGQVWHRSVGRTRAPAALDQLTPRVYRELHRMAAGYMRKERSGDTLQATALVQEGFLRLVEVERVS